QFLPNGLTKILQNLNFTILPPRPNSFQNHLYRTVLQNISINNNRTVIRFGLHFHFYQSFFQQLLSSYSHPQDVHCNRKIRPNNKRDQTGKVQGKLM
ncbi:hypothetical protein VIGAN_01242800, partial [Vigna angularis var. angularis]